MIYYVYTLPPNDWWHGFFTPIKFIDRCAHDEMHPEYLVQEALHWLAKMRSVVKAVAHDDFVYEAVSSVPNDDGTGYPIELYIGKQLNNGTTFLVSPVPMFHLRKSECQIVEWAETQCEA